MEVVNDSADQVSREIQKIPFQIACSSAGLNGYQISKLLNNQDQDFLCNGFIVDDEELLPNSCNQFFQKILQENQSFFREEKIDLKSTQEKSYTLEEIISLVNESPQNQANKSMIIKDNRSGGDDNSVTFQKPPRNILNIMFNKTLETLVPKSNLKEFCRAAEEFAFSGYVMEQQPTDNTESKIINSKQIQTLNEMIRNNEKQNRELFENKKEIRTKLIKLSPPTHPYLYTTNHH